MVQDKQRQGTIKNINRGSILLLMLAALLLSTGCQNAQTNTVASPTDASAAAPTPTPPEVDPTIAQNLPITTRTFQMGTAGFIPPGYPDASDRAWSTFLTEGAAGYGELFGVHVNPGAQPDQDGIPQQVKLAFEHMQGVKVYVAFAVNHEQGPFTEARAEELKRAAVATAKKYQPEYLSLGVESNALYLFQQETFPRYVRTARDIYDEVKAVSPDTLVMNNFQLDRMKGETDLTGQNFDPHWELISRFDGKMDLVSFTVYPYLHYRTPQAIPDDYLAEIREQTDLPVMITETGWPSRDTKSGVQGSHQLQIEYMKKLFQQSNSINLEGLIWVFPHDASFGIAGGIFDHISLRYNDGEAKPAFNYWQAALALPVKK